MTGDLDRALRTHLAAMPEAHRRLVEPVIDPAGDDRQLRDAVLAYLRHFTRIFDRGVDRTESERELIDELSGAAGTPRTDDDEADLDTAEAALRRALRARGLELLGGRTPPHLGAYIWRRTEERTFTVTLPRDDPQEVRVHLMHDFVLRGWLYWQTFGRQGAGGWYQEGDADWPDGLYCVRDRYGDPLEEDPAFRVSLLGHEAQHVADHRGHPGLSSAELEYRAKLVELIGYEAIEDRLQAFVADARDDPHFPHPYAAHRILTGLAGRLFGSAPPDADWASVPYERIRVTAQELLDEDTARLLDGRAR